MPIPEAAHYWAFFVAGRGLQVLKRASLSAQSSLSGTKTRPEWLRTNALNLTTRFLVTATTFGLAGDSLVDWAAAKIPLLQKEIQVVKAE